MKMQFINKWTRRKSICWLGSCEQLGLARGKLEQCEEEIVAHPMTVLSLLQSSPADGRCPPPPFYMSTVSARPFESLKPGFTTEAKGLTDLLCYPRERTLGPPGEVALALLLQPAPVLISHLLCSYLGPVPASTCPGASPARSRTGH